MMKCAVCGYDDLGTGDSAHWCHTLFVTGYATPPSPSTAPVVDDLAMLVRQLVHSLKKAKPDSDLAARAVDYLQRKGLAGSPLRSVSESAPSAAPIAEDEKHKATLRELLVCFASWEPDVRVLGNVRAEDAFQAIRAALSSRPAGEVEELRALVEEWLCESCNTVYPGPPARGFACVICPKCSGSTGPRMLMENRKLRAELALRPAGEVELPPLPEPLRFAQWTGGEEFAYTANQMHNYARAYGQECARAALASRPVADISECTEDMYWAALEVLQQWQLLDEANCVADQHRGIKAAINAALASKPAAQFDAAPPLSSEQQAEKGGKS